MSDDRREPCREEGEDGEVDEGHGCGELAGGGKADIDGEAEGIIRTCERLAGGTKGAREGERCDREGRLWDTTCALLLALSIHNAAYGYRR